MSRLKKKQIRKRRLPTRRRKRRMSKRSLMMHSRALLEMRLRRLLRNDKLLNFHLVNMFTNFYK